MTMTSARQRVFSYIQKHRSVSAAEIARDLSMTHANARHHLSLLKKNRQIDIVGERSAGLKGGRPTKIYGVSRNILGDGLPTLSHLLLEELLNTANPPQRSVLLRKLGQRLATSFARGTSSSPMSRLTEVVKYLNELGYHARWEAHASGPRIILGHCPYAAIIDEHPEICEIDKALISECLLEPMNQISKQEGDVGRLFCVFGVSKK